jgi:hypothetical protein
MSAFSQDENFLYIDRGELPAPQFTDLSEPAQVFEQVLRAFKSELITYNSLAFEWLNSEQLYRFINNKIVTKEILVITLISKPVFFDPDEVING